MFAGRFAVWLRRRWLGFWIVGGFCSFPGLLGLDCCCCVAWVAGGDYFVIVVFVA